MAVLSTAKRREAWAQMHADISAERESIAVTKDDLLAVFNALDDWFDANAATVNQAIPQPQRSALTARQKARILMLVLAKRFDVGA